MDRLKSATNKLSNNSRFSDEEDIPVYVVEDATACITSLILHEIVHRRVRDQSILVDEILAANLACEFRDSVTSPPVPLHVGHVHTHEVALGARHGLRCVRLLHVGVKHELLRIILVASDALERPMDAVRYPQVRDQSGDEMEFRLA